jgi:hypothetical protein
LVICIPPAKWKLRWSSKKALSLLFSCCLYWRLVSDLAEC